MNKYYNATIWINNNKPISMILNGKNKAMVEFEITDFYMRLNKLFHNINSFKIKLDRVYYINGRYLPISEVDKVWVR